MLTQTDYDEYLAEIRAQVCSRCIERPPGGPPCAPEGKRCGVELNLQKIIASVHGTSGETIEPYVCNLHDGVCTTCSNRPTNQCPCPLDYLITLAVQAIETVDERRRDRGAAVA